MDKPKPQLPPELIARIDSARTLPSRPPARRFVAPPTVSETLYARAKAHPNAPFLTYLAEDGTVRSYTYGEFYQRVCRIAAMLYVFDGFTGGVRIATAMHNHDQAILINFAAWHLGASVVPLNMSEDDKRLSYVLEHSGARVLFVLNDYLERMRPIWERLEGIHHVVRVDGDQPLPQASGKMSRPVPKRSQGESGEVDLLDVLPDVDIPYTSHTHRSGPDHEALIVYTSGTTGVPKGVVLSQYNLLVDAHAIAQWHAWNSATRLMCVLPVHHVNGLVVTHLTPMYSGGSVVLTRKFRAQNFFQHAATHKVQVVSVVPTLLQFLLEATPREFSVREQVPELQYVICGAGPLTVDLASRFEDRFGIPIVHGYGLSETTCYSCFLPVVKAQADRFLLESRAAASPDAEAGLAAVRAHTAWMREHGHPSIGVPVCANEMAIHDENGKELPEGEKGEIVIRGHNVMLGYQDNLAANEAAFTYGWFRTGDEGYFKRAPGGEMYFFITGRFKELIIRGGVKISPLDVDEVLNRVPGVKSAMAVGFDNTAYGEEVGAYVVKQPDSTLTEEAVLKACREKLPFWMSPKAVVFGETFPVTSTGKYQRNQLKPLFAAHRDVQFREGPRTTKEPE